MCFKGCCNKNTEKTTILPELFTMPVATRYANFVS